MSSSPLPTGRHLRSNSYDQAMVSEQLRVQQPVTTNPVPATERNDNDVYLIKWIDFNRERLPILLQNANGPCPLLAIANILLLRKRILLASTTTVISTERVIALIAEHILQSDSTKLSSEERANYERNIEDALAVLPKLTTGMDINLRFDGPDKFEYTRECVIFDVLGIQLFHGWIIDPQNAPLQKIMNANASSYNQLVEKMIRQGQSENGDLSRESLLIEQFLDDNRSQLTHYGILRLNETMRDNQLAVFFRNNHFSTIWKRRGQLLLLVSDQGYLNHPSIVFETLTDTDNDSTFTDGYGQIRREPAPIDTTRDRDLAIALHNEEQRQYRREQAPSREHHYDQRPRISKRKDRYQSHDDEYQDCCILL